MIRQPTKVYRTICLFQTTSLCETVNVLSAGSQPVPTSCADLDQLLYFFRKPSHTYYILAGVNEDVKFLQIVTTQFRQFITRPMYSGIVCVTWAGRSGQCSQSPRTRPPYSGIVCLMGRQVRPMFSIPEDPTALPGDRV